MRRVVFILLAVFIVLAAWLGSQVYTIYSGYKKIEATAPRATDEPTVVIPAFHSNHRVNFLLLGSDTDQKKEEAAPLTQSMIIVSVDSVNNTVSMLSIPRDFWVKIPGHGYGKIMLAFKYGYQKHGFSGGVSLARDVVERQFGVPIHYYAWVGLQGFSKVIDTFNGITLDIQHPVLDDRYPNDINSPDPYGYRRIFIAPGWQHMRGTAALEYVRSRHGDAVGDIGRSARQRQLLEALRTKITALNVLTRLPSLVSDLQDSVRTDLGLQQMDELYQLSHQIHRQQIRQVGLPPPLYCTYAFRQGQSVLLPNWAKVHALVRTLFGPIKPTHAPTPRPTATPRRATPTLTPSVAAPSPTAAPSQSPTAGPTSGVGQPARPPGRLLYVANGNMFELNPDGSTTQISWSKDAAMPALSPDRRTLAFVRFTVGLHKYGTYASDIWLMDLANRKQHIITHDENKNVSNNIWAAWPTWSPDGKRLLYATDRAKLSQPPSDARGTDLSLWSLSASGGQLRRLTAPPAALAGTCQMGGGAGGDTNPTWQPHGTHFLYVAWRYTISRCVATGQVLTRLMIGTSSAPSGVALTAPGHRVLEPTWSPSGRRVAYIEGGPGGNENVVVARLSVTPKGPRLSGWRVLARGKVGQPAFSADGRWVSYLRTEGDGFALYARRIAGGPEVRLLNVPSDLDARWTPIWLP
jgi:LCP family protein required for cell wall assembly